MRFSDERRAANLGMLSMNPSGLRAFNVGAFLEIALHDQLICEFASFLVACIGQPWALLDASYFLDDLDRRLSVVRTWAPSLQKRAISALNSMPGMFGLWAERVGARVPPIQIPTELTGLIVHERLASSALPLQAREFEILGLGRQEVLESLWACARRGWFSVDVAGDVVLIESTFPSIAAMYGLRTIRVS
jgi:hypothetical protein